MHALPVGKENPGDIPTSFVCRPATALRLFPKHWKWIRYTRCLLSSAEAEGLPGEVEAAKRPCHPLHPAPHQTLESSERKLFLLVWLHFLEPHHVALAVLKFTM